MSEKTPDDVLAEIRALKAVPDAVEGELQEDALNVDGFADLDSFFDDHLSLPIRGKVYRIAPANAELGLLCTRLINTGVQVATGGKAKAAPATLNDDDETELYQRLLGHAPFLAGTGSPAQYAELPEDAEPGTEPELLHPEVPPTPNPAYDPADDVWQQLFDDGLDWQRIQHVGTTAMIWTAVGKQAAQAFWASGARPKASATPPRAPQDRRPKGTGKSGRQGSTGGTTSPAKQKKGATAGT
jgi:hypothetical protein